jgi:hypothetical protein
MEKTEAIVFVTCLDVLSKNDVKHLRLTVLKCLEAEDSALKGFVFYTKAYAVPCLTDFVKLIDYT